MKKRREDIYLSYSLITANAEIEKVRFHTTTIAVIALPFTEEIDGVIGGTRKERSDRRCH